jgi:hypothetical protein
VLLERDQDFLELHQLLSSAIAGEGALDLVRFLGRRIDRTRSLVIATYRDDEIGLGHPLRKALGDLATAGGVKRHSLAPLTLDAVTQLTFGSGLEIAGTASAQNYLPQLGTQPT